LNDNVTLNDPGNNQITLASGVYFVSGTLQVKGNNPYISAPGGVLFIMLNGASFSMKGSGSFSLTGMSTVSSSPLPAILQPYASLLANMVFYDQSNSPVTIGGKSQITFDGDMYMPKASVTFQGNPSLNSSTCGNQLIASSIAFNGDPKMSFSNFDFNNSKCSAATKPLSEYVSLVQ